MGFIDSLPYADELHNKKDYAESLADRAEQIRVDARAKGGKGVNRQDALKQAETEMRSSIKSRDLAVPFGQANYIFDPYGDGKGVEGIGDTEDDDTDINDMEDEDTEDEVEDVPSDIKGTPQELKSGESKVYGKRRYRRNPATGKLQFVEL